MKIKRLNFQIQQGIKRLIDLLVSIIGLIFLAPFLFMIALAIKLDSPGGIIFSHQRIGKGGRSFKVYKFRTMVCGCSEKEHLEHLRRLIENEQSGKDKRSPYHKRDDDPRVTRVGMYLRRFYLDELPQLWNIIRGEMSLVGPRPHVKMEVDHYTKEQRRRLSIKPGLTGLWQATGKAKCTFRELIDLDLKYIDNWSLKLDLQIIFYTFVTIFRGGESFWAKKVNAFQEKKPTSQNVPAPEIFKIELIKQKEDDALINE